MLPGVHSVTQCAGFAGTYTRTRNTHAERACNASCRCVHTLWPRSITVTRTTTRVQHTPVCSRLLLPELPETLLRVWVLSGARRPAHGSAAVRPCVRALTAFASLPVLQLNSN
jgi:hypothetical protein